jgi:hypothetical protein
VRHQIYKTREVAVRYFLKGHSKEKDLEVNCGKHLPNLMGF